MLFRLQRQPFGRLEEVRSLGSVPHGQSGHDEDRVGLAEKRSFGFGN
jgi:hypothetical protein